MTFNSSIANALSYLLFQTTYILFNILAINLHFFIQIIIYLSTFPISKEERELYYIFFILIIIYALLSYSAKQLC